MVIKVENLEELKQQLIKKQLVLYGMGTIGMTIAQWLDQQEISYVFADRKALEKQPSVDKTVITPETVICSYKDANIIIATNVYFEEIKALLLKNGFSETQILSYALFVPQNIVWADLEDTINWELMRPSVELFSNWLDDEECSVADYGAGQMYLKAFLKPNVSYYPVDYIKRFEETIICDLNSGIFPNLEVDVAVFNGVLEFLTTSEELLLYSCARAKRKVILSYMTVDRFPNSEARRTSGYVSDLSEKQIIAILGRCGFSLTQKQPDPLDSTDTIYLFEKTQVS